MGPMNATDVLPPWTAVLTEGEHSLMLYAVTAAALALLATLVRLRFATAEAQAGFRAASLTANAVVAIALASYVLVLAAMLVGYHRTDSGWVPNELAVFAWLFRYVDWTITVPLLVVELLAVSALSSQRRLMRLRTVGVTAAFAMVLLGFLGAFIVGDGRSFAALATFGAVSALCFVVLAVLLVGVALRSLPRLPQVARPPYRAGVVLLLTVWFVYPLVYGLQGTTSGGAWAATGAVALSVADVIAKVGFGSLVHRTAVLRSRADEDAHPTSERRPRQPEADSLWVEQQTRLDPDPEFQQD